MSRTFKYVQKPEPKRFQWQPIIEMMIILVTVLGSTIPLYLHTDAKFNETVSALREETKEFHGRLCTIEANRKKD